MISPGRRSPRNPVALFGDYMRVTGTPSLAHEAGPPGLAGKTLGLVNGSTWVSLWGSYYGQKLLPGVKLVHSGSDAIQLNFMAAHKTGRPCPPAENIRIFIQQARQLVNLSGADAILITCSTMNRAAEAVRRALAPLHVPVVQIDQPMMEAAVARGGRILVVATHGPTVASTQALLRETAVRSGQTVQFEGVTVENAFDLLGEGKIEQHNRVIAKAIRRAQKTGHIDTVVLAQLSMSVFSLSHPRPESEFGAAVLTSGECGFRHMRELFLSLPPSTNAKVKARSL